MKNFLSRLFLFFPFNFFLFLQHLNTFNNIDENINIVIIYPILQILFMEYYFAKKMFLNFVFINFFILILKFFFLNLKFLIINFSF